MISAIPENLNLTACRDKLECSADSPDPPANLNTSLEFTGSDPEYEHDIQKYQCQTGYTLAGISHELINSDGQVELPCILYTPTASGNDSSNGTTIGKKHALKIYDRFTFKISHSGLEN